MQAVVSPLFSCSTIQEVLIKMTGAEHCFLRIQPNVAPIGSSTRPITCFSSTMAMLPIFRSLLQMIVSSLEWRPSQSMTLLMKRFRTFSIIALEYQE